MDAKRAKQILTDAKLTEFSKDSIYSLGWYLCAFEGDKTAVLNGRFTADDLEAIASWMRDPAGVLDA